MLKEYNIVSKLLSNKTNLAVSIKFRGFTIYLFPLCNICNCLSLGFNFLWRCWMIVGYGLGWHVMKGQLLEGILGSEQFSPPQFK